MTAKHLLRDQRHLFQALPTETIIIGTQTFPCLVPDDRVSNDWINGGIEQQPRATVILERTPFVPERGQQASYRGITWRVAEVLRGHSNAPVRVNLESVT
jgi:hypothetical protein